MADSGALSNRFPIPPTSQNTLLTSTSTTPTDLSSNEANGNQTPTSSSDPEPFVDSSSLTTAQLSRAAAQAVRVSFLRGEHKNAYFVVNSLRASLDPPGKGLNTKLPPMAHHLRFPDFKPIQFGRPVSPRLASHALLHELIRLGLTAKAAREAEFLMRNGVKIRSATFRATVCSLLQPTSSSHGQNQSLTALDRSRTRDGPDILNLSPAMVSDQCTRYAVRLLLKAGQYRQQRTQEMYDFAIHMCLLQGEVIVGTLLFVILVKSMQWRMEWASRTKAQADSIITESADELPHKPAAGSDAFRFLREERLYPKKWVMNALLAAIEETLAHDPQGEESQHSFRMSLQALANLAMLLDQRKIPHSDIAPLIRTLYRCPRVKDEVWIRQSGIPVRVCAYSYFHSVLQRLVGSLPSKHPSRFIKDPQTHLLLPPLDLTAYNSLLHYALRHRLSPALASKILNHMTKERRPPLQPSTVTYNILIRSGTLIRRSDISENALEALRRRKENVDHGIVIRPQRNEDTRLPPHINDHLPPDPTSRFSMALHRLRSETLVMPDDPQHTVPLSADAYTLSTYVTHLTSTGQPHVVANVLFQVLPELIIVDHPSWGQMSLEERKKLRVGSRHACLQRAVTYGPYFFTSVLNALCKAGKTGLAERVWLLAKQAEQASWIPRFAQDTEPWCLPVEGYTTMIQCYAAEAKVALDMRLANKNILNEKIFPDLHRTLGWTPRTKNPHVRGWARFILQRNRKQGRLDNTRRSAGKELGLLLFHSMRSGARDIYASLINIQHQIKNQSFSRKINIPRPDARFFNAALELFTRQPHMRARGARSNRARWRRQLRYANVWFARLGTLSRQWNPSVQEVAEQIVEAGYSVPPALRHLFVGRWTPGSVQRCRGRDLERRPFAFPPIRDDFFLPHTLHTWKSRGLPLGSRRIHQPGRTRRARRV